MLQAAYSGYQQFQNGDGQSRILGLYHVVTFGRSVTFVLQNLSGKADGFDEWYEEKREVLENDPVCSHMCDLRNRIVKEGNAGVSNYTEVGHINTADLSRKAPAWADGIFIGDQFGGSGFTIEQEDGSEMKFYYDFPNEDFETGLYFEGLKDSLDETEFPSSNAEEDLHYYLKVLAELVSEARTEFVETDPQEGNPPAEA